MIDRPGPWGTGPFTLTDGYSSISTRCAIQKARPFTCTWLIEGEDRSDELVLEANRDHWNAAARGPRLERVVFRNALSPAEALDLVCDTEGEVDIVSEVSPADAARVEGSEHATLVVCEANRVMAGIMNRTPGAPLADARARRAINLAVDQARVVEEGLGGYATVLPTLTPPWCAGYPEGAQPYPRDPGRARDLLAEAGWPEGRALEIATPSYLSGIAELIADEVRSGAGLTVNVTSVPPEGLIAGARALVEKKMAPPWDILVHAWFDLSSEAPPAAVHREFVGADGAFRAGPEVEAFDRIFAELVGTVDGATLVEAAERLDTLVHEEALLLFLCAPNALYAVNRHVRFGPYKTTFELAETAVGEEHWSRRD